MHDRTVRINWRPAGRAREFDPIHEINGDNGRAPVRELMRTTTELRLGSEQEQVVRLPCGETF